MSLAWPDALISEIAERRCVIFMGAGASMASVSRDGLSSPPGWAKLLKDMLPLVPRIADRRTASGLLKAEKFLDAAEIIRATVAAGDFTNYMQESLATPDFQPSRFHEIVKDIDPKVLITTNYDQIYEHFCVAGPAAAGYRVIKYSDDTLVQHLRSRLSLIVKAHGCISEPDRLVLSRSSYYKAKRDYAGFYDVLDALFLTQTILFVGCSLTDPDIQLVLENANISAPSSHPHYALVEKLGHPAMRAAVKTMHNIEVLEYRKGQYVEAVTAMTSMRDAVLSKRALKPTP